MNIKESKPYCILRSTYYAIKNWDKTRDDWKLYREIRPFRNIHIGKPCVIVGNGPSLKVEDLTKLYELGIHTFACNRIHMIFPQTPWRPSYYFMSDEKLISQYDDNVPDITPDRRFFPKQHRDKIRNGKFYNTLPFDYEVDSKFSTDAAKGIYPAGSVTTEMLQFAYYMGFSEIYLIGVDFNYSITQSLDNKTYSYQGESNYFIPGYLKPGEVADMPNFKANLLSFHAAKETIEGQGKIIMNATRGGKLEVFDRVNLDDLFAKWS